MIPLSSVLALDGLRLSAVHVPEPDAPVRWVATSELVDPAPFLEGGEFLLTTGLATAGWRNQWDAYVARLRDAGIAGLGLGTGLTHAKPPRGLVKACEQLGVNLLEVPRATTFVAVSRQTVNLLAEEEEATARSALELQRRLTTAAAGPDPTGAVLQRLARSLRGGACLLAPSGQLMSGSPRDAGVSEIRDHLTSMRSQGRHAALTLSEPGRTTVLQPVGVKGRPDAYLVTSTTEPPNPVQRHAVTVAAALLALLSEQRRDRTETRRRVAARAFELLISGDRHTAELLLESGERLVTFPRQARVLAGRGTVNAVEDGLAMAEAVAPLAAPFGDELVVVVPAGAAAELARRLAGAGVYVGVGDAVPLEHLALSRTTAVQALAKSSAARPVVTWTRAVREGLIALVDDQAASAFAASLLGSLSDVQLETLRSFLRHHGSRLKVAQELGLHRNTVRNRIRHIERSLGDSLDDPQLRMSTWFALQTLS